MEAAVAARADKGGGCMSCAMAALDIDASDLNVPRGQKSKVHDIANAAGAPEVQHDIDFKVRGKSHGSFELSYRGDARPAAVISNATSRTGGIGVFITGPADGTHTVLVIARPEGGGGYPFSYLDQHAHPGGRQFRFDAAGINEQFLGVTQRLVNSFPTGGGGRISHDLLIWQVLPR
jgi:hypothetical protein